MWKPEDNEMFKMYGKICQYKILFPMKIAFKYEGDKTAQQEILKKILQAEGNDLRCL